MYVLLKRNVIACLCVLNDMVVPNRWRLRVEAGGGGWGWSAGTKEGVPAPEPCPAEPIAFLALPMGLSPSFPHLCASQGTQIWFIQNKKEPLAQVKQIQLASSTSSA